MKKKLLIVGYPRSGNTWLGYLLSYVLGACYQELNAPANSNPTLQKKVLGLISGKLKYKSDYGAVVKTHKRYNFQSDSLNLSSFNKVIYIVRDPRDVAVSYFYFYHYNLPIACGKPEDALLRKPLFIKKYYWKKMILRVAQQWPLHVISWQSYQGIKLIKYESLHKNLLLTLKKLCKFLKTSPKKGLLKQAINHFTFKQLSGGRQAGKEQQTGFYRKGVVGDYKNYFDCPDTIIMRYYAGQQMQDLGYED